MSGSDGALVVAVFLATSVEMVEAATIVVAVGTTRGWRGAATGALAALGLLVALVAGLGPALMRIPIGTLRLVVGGLLLIFGLGWLRRALLDASGIAATAPAMVAGGPPPRALATPEPEAAPPPLALPSPSVPRHDHHLDAYAVTVSFKGVLLEGLEVAFIVLTLGSSQRRIGLAVLGAAASMAVVAAATFVLQARVSRLPETLLSVAVGVLLVSFGTFWGAEGTGIEWPGADAALPVLAGFVALTALVALAVLRRFVAGPAVATAP